ncbi:MAG TPA: preprotein translocase subunit SecG [Rudaea sp.]|jgi:preprotein translocase subunit SecG|uniref:preprotein translocase subunit SecG n=1 Tax=Rudaea sp. TaxID=2136325 RepID=UPI002F929E4F
MILNLFNIVYVLVAIAMIALILLQRGSGADAGSGFGGGASATVFGARGATTFLSRSTAVLAALFFLLSLTMAWYLGNAVTAKPADDLGVMSGVEVPAANGAAAAPAKGDVPAAAAPTAAAAAAPASDVPAAPVQVTPAPADGAAKNEAPAAKPAEPKKH